MQCYHTNSNCRAKQVKQAQIILLLRDFTINQFHTYQLSPINMKSPNFQTLTQSQDCSLKITQFSYFLDPRWISIFITKIKIIKVSLPLVSLHVPSQSICIIQMQYCFEKSNCLTLGQLHHYFKNPFFFNFTINQVQIQRTKFQSGKISK